MSTEKQKDGPNALPKKKFTKVAKFQIWKPVNMTWAELGKMLRDTRYRYWRLANMAVCENYMRFHQQYRAATPSASTESAEVHKVKNLNRLLRRMLIDEKQADTTELSRYSRDGAVSGYICGAFETMKLSSIKSKSKWRDVLRGKSALPLFKKDLSIPINASDKVNPSLIEKNAAGEFELDLRICQQPYPRVLLSTKNISDGERAVLERLVSNKANSPDAYQHRFFEIKERDGKWFLYVIYSFPQTKSATLNPEIIAGVDLGWSVPLYAAINNGKARIGYRKLKALGDNIKSLQKQIMARRRSIQNTGAQDLGFATARSGHGRKRLLQPIEKLQNKIDNAYTTLNHQLSHCVIEFAKNHGAGVIQIENLQGLADELKGTFLGMNWRREQLQSYIKYKAEEAGIKVNTVNPCYTSRRCSECGFIHKDFDFKFRQDNRKNGKSAEFVCPQCNFKGNADYNAARNLAVSDIEKKIRLQCQEQAIEYRELKESQ
jgi:IS605 OrfB family transposase